MSRITIAVVCATISLGLAGCFGGRPKDVAANPGDCYCELSDPQITNFNGSLRFKVHYCFPDGLPKHEAWFTCTFELQGSNTSAVTVRKAGSALSNEGDLEGTTNSAFLRRTDGTLSIQMRQADSKTGPYRPVSTPLVTDF